MFIKQLSEDAYLEATVKFGDIDFYLDGPSEYRALNALEGYISVHEDSFVTEDFKLIYDPFYKQHFFPVRRGQDDILRMVFVEEPPMCAKYYTTFVLNKDDFEDRVAPFQDSIVALILENKDSSLQHLYDIKLEYVR